MIDETYRTDPSRDATAIGGSSAGGICAFSIAWSNPNVFSKAICMSPAFEYKRPDGTMTVNYPPIFQTLDVPKNAPFFYINNGGVGVDALLQPGIHRMLSAMTAKGLEPDRDFTWRFFPDDPHHESAWAERLPAALELLFAVE